MIASEMESVKRYDNNLIKWEEEEEENDKREDEKERIRESLKVLMKKFKIEFHLSKIPSI